MIELAETDSQMTDKESILAHRQMSEQEQKAEKDEGYRKNAFNQFKSDRISLVTNPLHFIAQV